MKTTKVTFKQVKDLLDKEYHLVYIDYRDSLDHSLDKIQTCIHKGDWEALDMGVEHWLFDAQQYGLDYALDELKKEIQNKLDIEEEDAEEIMEEYEDEIRDTIYDRDCSTPIADLLRNTSDQAMFYDTGIEINDYSYDFDERLKEVKRALKIPIRNTEYDSDLGLMIDQASYGGKLVIYFYDSPGDWIDIDEKKNTIEFENYHVAIIDNSNGSGDNTEINHKTSFAFNRENIFICREVSYSYTHEVCGMVNDWCEGTSVSLHNRNRRGNTPKSKLNAHIEREAELDAVYKAGGCTIGDMKYGRHRNTTYINDFPCGNKCLDCGTFWID